MQKVRILLDWKIEILIQVKQRGYEFRKEIPKQRRPRCGGSKSLCTSESESHSVMSNSLWSHGLYSPWNSPGQNTGVCSLSLLQGIFPTHGLNPGLRHCRWILYQLSHKGIPPTHTLPCTKLAWNLGWLLNYTYEGHESKKSWEKS